MNSKHYEANRYGHFSASWYLFLLTSKYSPHLLFSNIPIFCCSSSARDQGSRPYKVMKSYTALYFNLYIFSLTEEQTSVKPVFPMNFSRSTILFLGIFFSENLTFQPWFFSSHPHYRNFLDLLIYVKLLIILLGLLDTVILILC